MVRYILRDKNSIWYKTIEAISDDAAIRQVIALKGADWNLKYNLYRLMEIR